MATADNLLLAAAEESKNRAMYLAFAERAEAEGQPQVARLFRAIAESERIHARGEIDLAASAGASAPEAAAVGGRAATGLMPPTATTAENLHRAVEIEEAEFQDTYARFLRQAVEEGEQAAAALLRNVIEVERIHRGLYAAALAAVQEGRRLPEAPVFVCRTCGNTVVGRRPEACPICGSPAAKFAEVA